MMHYHGTPLSPHSELEKLAGKNFCVSYVSGRKIDWILDNAQSVMWDNGAFSSYTRGLKLDVKGYYEWVDDKLYGSNWGVVPDVIGGSVDEQKELMSSWKFPDHVSCYVWHMDLPLDWLKELCNTYPRIAFGSSGEYWKVGSEDWKNRADDAWELIESTGCRPWVHMMRGLSVCGKRWPFASADSTNVARNFKNKGKEKCPKSMAETIDARQSPLRFRRETLNFGERGYG